MKVQQATRIGAGLLALASLLWLLWPDEHWKVEPEAAIAFGSALFVWFWQEYLSLSTGIEPGPEREGVPHSHDLQLARTVREAFDEHTKRFLRTHSFGVSFRDDRMKQIEHVADDWHGVDFEFIDKDLDAKLSNFIRLCRGLAEKTSAYAGYVRDGVLSVPNTQERAADTFRNETREQIKELDGLASEVLQAYEDLEREIRQKLPGIYSL
jgi:hypothetical protein